MTTATARRVPPVLAAWLVVMWLLLNQTVSVGHLVLGVILGVVLASASRALRPLQPRLRNAHLVPALFSVVLLDIIRSNVAVARIVLGFVRGRRLRSGFVKIPLELTDPHGLAVLAGIVTATPGTVWAHHDAATRTLTLHVLDLRDEGEWIDWVKSRYERRLREIFE
jgi:multicomponent K+:H+ antiporter subunit E